MTHFRTNRPWLAFLVVVLIGVVYFGRLVLVGNTLCNVTYSDAISVVHHKISLPKSGTKYSITSTPHETYAMVEIEESKAIEWVTNMGGAVRELEFGAAVMDICRDESYQVEPAWRSTFVHDSVTINVVYAKAQGSAFINSR